MTVDELKFSAQPIRLRFPIRHSYLKGASSEMFFSFSEAQSVSLLFLPLALISYVQGSGVFVVDLCSLCGDSKTVKKKANMLTQT